MADLRNDIPGQQPLSESCSTYASLLTALFDEEIDESAARLARGHLERCARCADMWQAWEHNRSILQTAPAPLPPVTLLARILLACRLVALTRRNGTVRVAHPHRSIEDSIVHRENAASENSTPAFLSVPAPPPDLQESILRLTTRRAESPDVELLAALKPAVAVKPVSFEPQETRRTKWLSRSARFATVAVPAVLLWVSLIAPSNRVPLQTPVSEPAVNESAVSESTNEAAVSGNAAAPHAPANPVESSARASRVAGDPKTRIAGTIAVTGKAAPVLTTKPSDESKATPVAIAGRVAEAQPEAPVRPRVAARRNDEDDEAPRVRRSESHGGESRARVERVAELPELAPRAHPRTMTSAVVTASLSRQSRPTPVRVARYVRPTAPRTTSMREKVAEPAESSSSGIEVLQEVHGLNENRDNDVRQVVEEYRASLISEISDSSDDEGDYSSDEF